MHVLAGPSGSGKSSLLNAMNHRLQLRVGDVSDKNARGRHTTRHAALLQIDDDDPYTLIADTPGFSNLRFDQHRTAEIEAAFPDFAPYRKQCMFSDCLHLSETGCHVLENTQAIAPSRYASYRTLIEEAREYEAFLKKNSIKVERGYKRLDGGEAQSIEIVRLREKNRDPGRRTMKQKVEQLYLETDEDENEF
jgi:ribosome biogenesis GTPase